jgi:Tol biopolymer transport system component
MVLTPGARYGTYAILDSLGAGGMGEVYRARDTRLQREVAVKVLPADLASDHERLARFEREARSLAALNHPGIAQIYGLEGGGSQAIPAMLVMELVEGEDLAVRIARGPVPVDDALAIARQIASALDAAHTAGIVHRDLKPANIKLRDDGTVKLLDFGLARTVDGAGAEGRPGQGLPSSPTITSPAMTMRGVILGTAGYMSPEQARGKTVDKRADIWAFGCVLGEMLTGRPVFDGETVTDVLGAIVKSEPDWARLPADTPPWVAHLLRRCLQKDASGRLRDIGDAMVELHGTVEPAPLARPIAPAGTPVARRAAWAAATLLIALAAVGIGYVARRPVEPALLKVQMPVPPDIGYIREPVISPDGRKIVYVGRARLWVQALDEWEPKSLDGTEGAVRPFWSPDSRWIAYFRGQLILKVPAAGGAVVRVGAIPAVQSAFGSHSGSWAEDGTVTASLATGPLLRIPAAGGDATPFPLVPTEGIVDLHDVGGLPGGALLATARRVKGIDAIVVLRDGRLKIVLEATEVRRPVYSPTAHLIYERRTSNAGIWAVPFSLDRLEVTGEPFLVSQGAEPSVARDGTLALDRQGGAPPQQLAWFTLDGMPGARIAEPRPWTEGVAISKDSRRVIATTSEGLWIYDAETGTRRRLTDDPADIMPEWVDDNRVLFVRVANGETVLMLKQLSSGQETALARAARFPRSTADGKRVVFNIRMEGAPQWQIAWIDFDEPREIKRLGGMHIGARFPSVSPDGTLVAYVSGEIGGDEVFLTELPSGEGKYQISTAGGGWTLFSPRGDTLVYRSIDDDLMSVPVASVGGETKIGLPQKLFSWGTGWAPYYDLAPDGKRGVTAVPIGTSPLPAVSIVQNWQSELLRR